MRELIVCFVLGVFASIAQCETLIWDFQLDEQQIRNGPQADGSTDSPGVGTGRVEYDTVTNIISYTFDWDALMGELTKLHIHGPADANSSNHQHVIDVLNPPLPPELAATSGSYSAIHPLEHSHGHHALAVPDILQILGDGEAYVNVHTTAFPNGEIRGNLGIPVPEPTSGLLGITALIAFPMLQKRRR